ncbi:MAG: rhomboid family intramembrane serine protease [Desulfurococcaceae archaeon]
MAVIPGERFKGGRFKPIITVLLVAVNVLVYVYTSLFSNLPLIESSQDSIMQFGFKPIYVFTNPTEAIIKSLTSMFIHADILHIFFNMYFLWLFGSRLEGFIGHKRFLLLYFLSGLSAVLFYVAYIPVGGYDSLSIPAVGASGAISGVLGAYLLMLPYTKLVVCMFFFLFPFCFRLSAAAFLILWFAEQILYGYLKLGGVAYFAHVGGFVMGVLLAPLLARYVSRKPGFMDYFYNYLHELYGIQITRPRGLGKGTKVVLTLLFILIIGGFTYGAYSASTHRSQVTYALDVSTLVDGVFQRDQAIMRIMDSQIDVSISQLTNVRILINRLAPIMYNKTYALSTVNRTLEYTAIVNNIAVPVVFQGVIQYDDQGVATHASGVVQSRVVQYDARFGRYIVGDYISIDFTLTSKKLDYSVFTVFCFIAAAVGAFAISAVLKAEEATIFTRPEFPELFPYI